MRKAAKLIVAVLMVFAIVAPISLPIPGVVSVAQAATVKISKKTLNLKIGKTKVLTVTGTKNKVTWKSDDNKIATVSKNGKVAAIAAGKTNVIATVDDKDYTCSVTVTRPENPYVKDAKFDAEEKTLNNISFVVPSDWIYTELSSAEEMSQAVIIPSGKLSNLLISIQHNDMKVMDYNVFKSSLSKCASKEYIETLLKPSIPDVVVSNFSTTDFTYSSGQAFVMSYSLSAGGGNQTRYKFLIENYGIEVVATDLTDDVDIITYAEYLINSIR